MEKLGEEALARLDVLAAKMGVGAEHMWEVLTKQGLYEGWFAVACVAAGVLGFLSGLCVFVVFVRRDIDKLTPTKFILWITGLVVAGLSVILIAANAESILYLFNPEMYALEYVRGLLQ